MNKQSTLPGISFMATPIFELRALLEAATIPCALPWLLNVPKGDGHPVVLVPGFMAGEMAMGLLELYLRNRGYQVSTWGFGRNIGFHSKHAKALEQKIRYLHYKTGRKVSLVGWSLGGIFSIFAANRAPECVRGVITLGSPIYIDVNDDRHSRRWLKAFYRLAGHRMGIDLLVNQVTHELRNLHERLPMPVSCLYGVADGMVTPTEVVFGSDAKHHEGIRVPASHVGMVANPMALWAIADRLAQPEDDWQPFSPGGASASAFRWLTHARSPL